MVVALYDAIKEELYNHPQELKNTGCNMDPWATSFAYRERISEVVLALGAARDITTKPTTYSDKDGS